MADGKTKREDPGLATEEDLLPQVEGYEPQSFRHVTPTFPQLMERRARCGEKAGEDHRSGERGAQVKKERSTFEPFRVTTAAVETGQLTDYLDQVLASRARLADLVEGLHPTIGDRALDAPLPAPGSEEAIRRGFEDAIAKSLTEFDRWATATKDRVNSEPDKTDIDHGQYLLTTARWASLTLWHMDDEDWLRALAFAAMAGASGVRAGLDILTKFTGGGVPGRKAKRPSPAFGRWIANTYHSVSDAKKGLSELAADDEGYWMVKSEGFDFDVERVGLNDRGKEVVSFAAREAGTGNIVCVGAERAFATIAKDISKKNRDGRYRPR